MALNFPDSPSDGQAVILNGNNFVYSSANNQWTKKVGNMIMSDNAPSNPIPGQMWFDTTVLKTFVYYADGSSSQWVEINTSGSAGPTGTFDGTSAVTGNIIPDLDSAYDLGSPTKKFRSLHLSGNTLFLGDSGSISSGAGGAISLPSISIGTGANTIKLEASASGKLETKSTVGGVEQVAVPAVETIEQLSNVDLTIAPEVLEIQVADPTAGHGTAWLWTWLTSSLPYARTSITNSDQLSVPLYMQGTYQINNFANTQYGSMTQAHTFKLKWIEGAGDQNLVSWPTYSVVNHTHASINSGTETSVQRLSFSVPSSITPPSYGDIYCRLWLRRIYI